VASFPRRHLCTNKDVRDYHRKQCALSSVIAFWRLCCYSVLLLCRLLAIEDPRPEDYDTLACAWPKHMSCTRLSSSRFFFPVMKNLVACSCSRGHTTPHTKARPPRHLFVSLPPRRRTCTYVRSFHHVASERSSTTHTETNQRFSLLAFSVGS
jgi:hypothetical protein